MADGSANAQQPPASSPPQTPPPQYSHRRHNPNAVYPAETSREPAVVITSQPSSSGQHETTIIRRINNYERKWIAGLCDCGYDVQTCAFVAFCCPCAACLATHRIGENSCYPVAFGMVPISVRFRALARIRQSMCEEGCLWYWCPCLMTCRLMNEMEIRGFTSWNSPA